MQPGEELEPKTVKKAKDLWLRQRDLTILGALQFIGGIENIKDSSLKETLINIQKREKLLLYPLLPPIHKQIVNRLLEPFSWQIIIASATEWSNFIALRTDYSPQAEIKKGALLIKELLEDNIPTTLNENEWHLPLISEEEKETLSQDVQKKLSVGRCARVSYQTHNKQREMEKDIALHDTLLASGHLSPFEHVARPLTDNAKENFPIPGQF